jgi:spore coat polysaccharide biosynthesis protein SpsF
MKTEQESFWQGEFGDSYIDRNQGDDWVAANLAMFSRILGRTCEVESVLELGPNIGLNLTAIKRILPRVKLSAVEINEKAVKILKLNLPEVDVQHTSILDFDHSSTKYDLVFTKGVLIHINPDYLNVVYDKIFEASSKYVLVSEYYNPKPVEVQYRGHSEKLFKRDFAGEMLDRFPSLQLVDYGFIYHRDLNFPQDDMSWFLMEKC